jgi:MFS family permease
MLGLERVSIIITCCLNVVCVGFFYAFGLFAADIKTTQNYTQTQITLIGVCTYLVAFGSQLFVSVLLDALGPRVVGIMGMCLYAAGQGTVYFILRFGPVHYGWMLLAYAIMGLGAAANFASILKIISEWFERDELLRGKTKFFVVVLYSVSGLLLSIMYYVGDRPVNYKLETAQLCVSIFSSFTALLSIFCLRNYNWGYIYISTKGDTIYEPASQSSHNTPNASPRTYGTNQTTVDSISQSLVEPHETETKSKIKSVFCCCCPSSTMQDYANRAKCTETTNFYLSGFRTLFSKSDNWVFGVLTFILNGMIVACYYNIETMAISLGENSSMAPLFILVFGCAQLLGSAFFGILFYYRKSTNSLSCCAAITLALCIGFILMAFPTKASFYIFVTCLGCSHGAFYMLIAEFCQWDRGFEPGESTFGQRWAFFSVFMAVGPMFFDLLASIWYDDNITSKEGYNCVGRDCFDVFFWICIGILSITILFQTMGIVSSCLKKNRNLILEETTL